MAHRRQLAIRDRSPYDIVRLPGFEFPIESPRAAYVARLKAVFPGEVAAIDGYFAARDECWSAVISGTYQHPS